MLSSMPQNRAQLYLVGGCDNRISTVYGSSFNPLITLKALCYFKDVPALPIEVQARLTAAVAAVDVTKLPALTPYATRPDHGFTL